VTTTTATPRPGWLRDLLRAAAAPAICAVVLVGLLSAWVTIGGAGTISRVRIQVTRAAIPMSSFGASAVGGSTASAAYLTIRNLSGRADELTRASSPAGRRAILTRQAGGSTLVSGHSAGSAVASLPVPAHGVVILSPFGSDIILTGTAGLQAGQQVPLTLTFRNAGQMTVEATVTPPGAP
jgi:copper(I)-binding protein